jgi:hypothetical protein
MHGRTARRAPFVVMALVVAAHLALAAPRGSAAAARGDSLPLTPAATAQAIASACIDRRYSEVSELLHSSLRRMWIDIGYKVKDFCGLITREYTLRSVRIGKEELIGEHALVFLTYVYQGGTESEDRATFLKEKGAWKLAN